MIIRRNLHLSRKVYSCALQEGGRAKGTTWNYKKTRQRPGKINPKPPARFLSGFHLFIDNRNLDPAVSFAAVICFVGRYGARLAIPSYINITEVNLSDLFQESGHCLRALH